MNAKHNLKMGDKVALKKPYKTGYFANGDESFAGEGVVCEVLSGTHVSLYFGNYANKVDFHVNEIKGRCA